MACITPNIQRYILRIQRDFNRFLQLLAMRVGSLLSMNNLAADVGVSAPTIKSWIPVLEASDIIPTSEAKIHLLECKWSAINIKDEPDSIQKIRTQNPHLIARRIIVHAGSGELKTKEGLEKISVENIHKITKVSNEE